ncbi:MAG TPA: NADH:flavin oxidoreductase [Thermoleophilia bacterium]|nr:NADH:flavin oxidoreductase [Thermoleophilia bacterium]
MSHLLEPLTIRTLTLQNRLVLPPMASSKARPDGGMSDELLAYYDEKSRGGALGLAITEHCFISEQGRNRVGQPSVADDAMIDGLAALAEVFHGNGVPAVVQVSHAGAASAEPEKHLVGPSDVATPIGSGRAPRALTGEEVADIPCQFAAAARRVKEAGFDGVELHSAHAYLLNQFLSPLTNRRTDRYGGSLENRIRLHIEAIRAVRDEVGPDFLVLLRLGARDYLEGGTVIDDSIEAALRFEEAGVDVLDITGGLTGYTRPGIDEPGYFSELSAPIKSAVSVPVILTGGVTEADQAESLLSRGAADLIGVGRAMLRDSAWAVNAVRTAP